MKSHTEMKQYIAKEAEKFNSKEGSNILDVGFEVANKIVEHAIEWDKFYYNTLLRSGKLPNEIIELERLFLNEFYKEISFDEDLEKLELARNLEQSEIAESKIVDLSETIPKIISSRSNHTELSDLLLKILVLREKIENKENQSFYFRKGFNSEMIKLNELEGNYNFHRTFVNVHPSEFINIEIKKSKKVLQENRDNKERSVMSRVVIDNAYNSRLVFLQRCLAEQDYCKTKGKGYRIGSVGFYLENEGKVLDYFGIEN
jgi:hypothetical protein